jgi:cytochrome b561
MRQIWQALYKVIRKLFIEHSPLQGYVAHIPHGVFTVLAAIYIHWLIALLFGAGFIIFELQQGKDYGDKPSDDLAGWLLGMVLAGVAYMVAHLGGFI